MPTRLSLEARLERARRYRELRDQGITIPALAHAEGVSATTITNALRLLRDYERNHHAQTEEAAP